MLYAWCALDRFDVVTVGACREQVEMIHHKQWFNDRVLKLSE
jgi:hypothetical protein